MSAYNLENVASVVWGTSHESEAIESYTGKGGIVKETGICSYMLILYIIWFVREL